MTMALRKIALMHRLFGVCEGHACRECSNLVKGRYHDRILTKCKVYGLTHSEASDWAGRWQACGMFNRGVYGVCFVSGEKGGGRQWLIHGISWKMGSLWRQPHETNHNPAERRGAYQHSG